MKKPDASRKNLLREGPFLFVLFLSQTFSRSGCLPDLITAFNHQIFDVRFEMETTKSEPASFLIFTVWFFYQMALFRSAQWNSEMDICDWSNDFIEKTFSCCFSSNRSGKLAKSLSVFLNPLIVSM